MSRTHVLALSRQLGDLCVDFCGVALMFHAVIVLCEPGSRALTTSHIPCPRIIRSARTRYWEPPSSIRGFTTGLRVALGEAFMR